MQLTTAVQKVKKDLSSRVYGILVATLHRHAPEVKIRAERPTILTSEEEKEIVYSCQITKNNLNIVCYISFTC